MILMRKTSLRTSNTTKFGVKGLYQIEAPRTEDGVIVDGIEILTRNVKEIIAIPDRIMLNDKELDKEYFTSTDIGPLVTEGEDIVQLNRHGEPVAKMNKDLFSALKLISLSKYTPEPISMKQNVIEHMEDYGLIKRRLIPKEVPLITEIDGRLLNSLGEKRILFCSNFKQLKKSIPHYYTNKSTEVLIQLILETEGYLSVNEVNKLFVINNTIYSVRKFKDSMEVLSAELMGWE